MKSQTTEQSHPIMLTYRNAIYQGHFNSQTQHRQGYGLLYTTNNNTIIGSHWINDQANSATLIYQNHSYYMYGFWKDNLPHGFNSIRLGKIVLYAFYQMGTIQGHMLVIFQQSNMAVIVTKKGLQEFYQIEKGEILSDNDFNIFIKLCNWPIFPDQWKTLIKFTSSKLSNQNQPKSDTPKLRLVNKTFYRYGYDDGLAIIFDDSYKILSLGIHKRTKLKSIGIRYNKQQFIQQGNFIHESSVIVYNCNERPQARLHKIYSRYLLPNINFINKFIVNPAHNALSTFSQQLKSHYFTTLIRQLSMSYIQIDSTNPLIEQSTNQYPKNNQCQFNENEYHLNKLCQQKKMLQLYKKYINDNINNKKYIKSTTDIKQLTPQPKNKQIKLIHKRQVEVPLSAQNRKRYDQDLGNHHHRRKSRSPIFTPQKNSPKQEKVSPFKQKIHYKIFQNQKKISQPHPNIKWSSPHQQLQESRSSSNHYETSERLPITTKINKKNDKDNIANEDKLSKSVSSKSFQQQSISPQIDNQTLLNNCDKIIQPNKRQIYQPNHNGKPPTNANMPSLSSNLSPNLSINSLHNPNPFSKPSPKLDQNDPSRKRNDVYLNSVVSLKKVSPSPQPPSQQTKKQIKGYSYLQKFNKKQQKTQQKYPTPKKQQNKYNQTIKNFNKNNKLYTLVHNQQQKPKYIYKDKSQQIKFNQQEIYTKRSINNTDSVRIKKYNYQYYRH